MLVVCLFMFTGCGAKFFAEQTSVELYRPNGSMFGKVFSNKGYDGFECKVDIDKNGEQHFLWKAHKVNSDTVAQTALEANKELSKALAGTISTIGAVGGAVVGVPIQ